MKFVKSAVAVAITTGIAAAPMIASADTTLSGVVEVKLAGTDAEDENGDTVNPDIQAGDVRVGVVSEHELSSGLIGYGSIKLTVDDLLGEVNGTDVRVPGEMTTLDDEEQEVNIGTVKADDIYVGVKGGFGDVRFGEIPLAVEYGQLANDIHDVADDVGDAMSYTGTFGPASIVLNYSPSNDTDMFGAGAKFNFAGATIGIGFEDRDEAANVAAGVSYAIGGFSIAAQYWAQEQDFDPDIAINTDDGDDDDVQTSGFDLDDTTSIAIKAGYGIGAFSGAVTYSILESQEGSQDTATGVFGTSDAEETIIRLDLAYDLGGGLTASTRIDNVSDDNDDTDDVVNYRVQLAKTF